MIQRYKKQLPALLLAIAEGQNEEMKGTHMTLSNVRKAVVAFVGLLATNAVADLAQDGHPFPTNWGDAARWAASVVLATAAVYGVKPAKGVNTPPAQPVVEPAAGSAWL